MLMQSVFEKWGEDIKLAFENADPVEVWAWVLLSIGIVCAFLLIFFSEYKRTERDSMKFTIIMVFLTSIFLGLGFDMLLTVQGKW